MTLSVYAVAVSLAGGEREGEVREAGPPWRIKSFLRMANEAGYFRPSPVILRSRLPASRQPGAVLVLDFGTTATTCAYLRVRSDVRQIGGNLPFAKDLASWEHVLTVPNFDAQVAADEVRADAILWEAADRFGPGNCPVIPPDQLSTRKPVPQKGDEAVPSLLYALPGPAASEPDTRPLNAIGHEAAALLTAAPTSGGAVDPGRFLYAPKLTVGQSRAHWQGFDRFRQGADPVALYLTEYLDDAVGYFLRNDPAMSGPLERICYSYPVTWIEGQRKEFRRALQESVRRSRISDLLAPGADLNAVCLADLSMNEGSAAFLGLVQKRFRGLDGADLVHVFAPFEPGSTRPEDPLSMHVLVFDCGGGTTDVVLVKLTDEGKDNRQAVEAKVVHHFAIEKAGLEVTRRIAEWLKDQIRESAPAVAREVLRTNLRDPDLERTFIPSTTTPIQRHRREFIVRLYEEAEAVKIALATGDTHEIRWANLLPPGPWPAPTSTRSLSRQELEKIVRDVLGTAFGQVGLWFSQTNAPRVDVLLMSGRSSQLPGVREELLQAIPEHLRPYVIDRVEAASIDLDPNSNGPQDGKTVVAAGLAQNYWNRMQPQGKGLLCLPIDEKFRTRCIGVLQMSNDGQLLPAFHQVLVEPDNQRIPDPETLDDDKLPWFEVTQVLSRGFGLGINFSGTHGSGSTLDAPQPFLRILIEGSHPGMFSRLRFSFRQWSATDLRLCRVELFQRDQQGPVEHERDLDLEPERLDKPIQIGQLTIRQEPYRTVDDFRVTGRIHTCGNDALDQDS
jgi:hypothetical protein